MILIAFFGFGFIVMGMLYYNERKRYERKNFNCNYFAKKYKQLSEKYNDYE